MNPWLVRHLVYPLHERLCGRKTFAYLRAIEQSQWWTPKDLRKLQLTKLRALLDHAARHCPFYAGRLRRAGVNPRRLDTLDALVDIPTLSKDQIRAHRREMLWQGSPYPMYRFATGGSTGQPLVFYFDRRRQAYDKAARMRTHRWFGADVGDREIYLWGAPAELRRQDRLRSLRDRLVNESLLSAFDMNASSMRRYLECIERYQPASLFGYPSSLSLLARFGDKHMPGLNAAALKVVFVTGERLDEDQRRWIERYFGVPVADGYGAREAGFIAHQCPEGRMHVTSENVIVELLDADGNPTPAGRTGEIVVTHLDAYAMPFIRYRTGDCGRWVSSGCACGRGLQIIDAIQGRKTDFLIKTDGSVAHALALIYVLRGIDQIEAFQIHQRADLSVDIKVVLRAELDETLRQSIVTGVRSYLGRDTVVRLHVADAIQPAASGKYRYVISDAASEVLGDTASAQHLIAVEEQTVGAFS